MKSSITHVERVTFICSCATPGKCGVGDYTLKLAHECLKCNISPSIIAIKDKTVDAKVLKRGDIKILQLPSAQGRRKRMTIAKRFIQSTNPQLASLQFVSHAHHRRGMPVGLGRALKELLSGIPSHVMFHEIWGGWQARASIKHRIYGAIQKRIVKDLHTRLRPIAVHTSNKPYQHQLERVGISSQLLPIFSNIDVIESVTAKWTIDDRLSSNGVGTRGGSRVRIGVLFGTLQKDWPIDDFIGDLRTAGSRFSCSPILCFAGRQSHEGRTVLRTLSNAAEDIPCIDFGELDEAHFSALLKRADFGVSNTVPNLLGKSGAAAAMQLHGLPVIAPRSPLRSRAGGRDEGFEYPDGVFARVEEYLAAVGGGNKQDIRIPSVTVHKVFENMMGCFLSQRRRPVREGKKYAALP